MVAAYVENVARAIKAHDGYRLKHLLNLSSALAGGANLSLTHLAQAQLPAEWAEFLALHIACLSALHAKDFDRAYLKLVAALQPFLKVFREDRSAWVVQPMHSMVHNLSIVAMAADAELKQRGRRASKLGDCGDQLRRCFSVSLQAPGNKAKKLAALDIVNVSIKIYFRLNTLRLCRNLTRTVDSPQFANFDEFPISQRVTYKFYVGRLAVFDEKYHDAQESLQYALRHCHRSAMRNKALILKYLVPVQLLLGRLPAPAQVAAYGLQQYQPLIAAMRTGNVKLLEDALFNQQHQFIQEGTYLLLEKIRYTVYRRLLRKVHAVRALMDPDRRNQLPLQQLQAALAIQNILMDLEEVECIAANLIYRKYVKAYLSHDKKTAVLAKLHPFPGLASVLLTA